MNTNEDTSNIFITFLILTYRRPQKVKRLLEYFLRLEWSEIRSHGAEIIIADDHSEDETPQVIRSVIDQLREQSWSVNYLYRENNLKADVNLFEGYRSDAKGEYVWLLCDDDKLIIENAIDFINKLRKFRPAVAICGFRQGTKIRLGNQKLMGYPELLESLPESIHVASYYAKTSAYILKRTDDSYINKVFPKWDGSLYSWIGISILLLTRQSNAKLLNYHNVCVTGDEDYGKLHYSFRVFANLSRVVSEAVEDSCFEFNNLLPETKSLIRNNRDIYVLCAQGLQSHYSFKSEISYEKKRLLCEWIFLKKNLFRYFKSIDRFFSLLKFILQYSVSKTMFKNLK